MKAFPIPVVALGPGTQTEDESLDYLPMPKDMDTYRAPMLPEPEEIAGRAATRDALCKALALLDRAVAEFARLDCPPEQAWSLLQRGRAMLGLGRPQAARVWAVLQGLGYAGLVAAVALP